MEELNATSNAEASTIWRPIVSASWQQRGRQQLMLKAEDVVCFYHKEAERYLGTDSRIGRVTLSTLRRGV